jgi:hypothetical protein
MKRIQSTLNLALHRANRLSVLRSSRSAILTVLLCGFLVAAPTVFVAGQKGAPPATGQKSGPSEQKGSDKGPGVEFYSSKAVGFVVTAAAREVIPSQLTPEALEKHRRKHENQEKNTTNTPRRSDRRSSLQKMDQSRIGPLIMRKTVKARSIW